MAKIEFHGLDDYIGQLDRFAGATEEVCGYTIFEGAKVVADRIRSNMGKIPVIRTRLIGKDSDDKLDGITATQMAGLQAGLGIATMRHEHDGYNVKIGFSGYNNEHGGQNSNYNRTGQPNALIARSVNSGTSFRKRIPFIDNAVRSSKGKALNAMEKEAEKQIKKYFK